MLLFDQPDAPWQLALFIVAAWTWFAAGVVAARRRPGNRMGAIMVVGAFVWLGAGLANAPLAALSAVGLVVQLLPLALVVHLLHAFPSGRLRGGASRVIVAGVYTAALLLHAPAYLFAPGDAAATLQLADRPDLVTLGATVQDTIGGALMVATGVLLALRMRSATQAQRRLLAPLALYGIVAVVSTPLLSRLLDGAPLAFFTAQTLLLTGVPVAFAAAMAIGGFAPTAGVAQLSAWLGAADNAPATLRGAVADALGDGSVALLLWAGERWVDSDGRAAALPDAGATDAGRPVAGAGGRGPRA
ncbi:sensor histidine kinase, partial [Conexibacter sp. JD483]|nr:sensor histidine kinase [Conexibacter sp. JD483]